MSFLTSLTERVLDREPGPIHIEADDFFATLANERRRATIRAVASLSPGTSLDDKEITTAVGHRLGEETTERGGLTEDARKRVWTALYQVHLPWLREFGLLEWDNHQMGYHAIRPNRRTRATAKVIAEIDEALEAHTNPPVDNGVDPLDRQDAYELLRHERSRHVISLLADVEAGNDVTLDWIANGVTEIETGHDRRHPPTKLRKARYVSVYQVHLPNLQDAGIVRWDGRDPLTVTERIKPLASAMRAGESRIEGGENA